MQLSYSYALSLLVSLEEKGEADSTGKNMKA